MTRRRRLVLVGAGVVAALLGVAAWWLLRTPSEQPFWDYVAALKAKGEPTTFEELAGPAPPDAENAAPEIEAALAAAEEEIGREWKWPKGVVSEKGVWFPPVVTALSETESSALTDFADRLKPFADRVAAALERPRFRYPVVLRGDGLPDAPQLDRLRDVVFLLDARARFARDADARLSACRSLARIGARLEADIWDEERQANGAIIGFATALREAAASGAWNPAAARSRLDDALGAKCLPKIRRPLLWGGLYVARAYASLLDGRLPSDRERLGVTMFTWNRVKGVAERIKGAPIARPFERGTADEVVATCRLYRSAADLPTGSGPRFHASFHSLKKTGGLGWMSENGCDLFASLVASDGRLRLARAALALGEFRADRGDYPSSLDELRGLFADGVPLDPYTDMPFLYERTAQGVRVWSACHDPPQKAAMFDDAFGFVLAWELKR